MMDKKAQRKLLKGKIAVLTSDEKRSFSRAIGEAVLSDEAFFSAKSIFIFRSTDDEPDTSFIISAALSLGKEVYLPRIEEDRMLLIRYRKGDELRLNRYGIEEPQGAPYFGKVDLAIVPLLGFSRDRARLGRGKGYYDRFFASFDGDSVALAFSVQELPEIDCDDWDKKPHRIFTEKEKI